MKLQFNKSSIRCLETALQQVKNTEVTQELRLPDGMPDIGRVLNTWGQMIIRSKQWQGDTLQLSGGVMVWVLYAPEDGTEPRSVDGWMTFQINWNLDEVKREGPMRIIPMLTFTDSRSTSSRKLMMRAGLSALVQALSPMDAEVYTPEAVPEDVQLLKRIYPVAVPVEGGEKTFLIDDELTLPEAGAVPQKIMGLTVTPEITEKKVMSDKVVFKGQLNVHSVCRYDDGEIRSVEQSVPFSQLADLDSTYGTEAQADICMAVTSLEADMTQPGQIRLKCGLVAQYLIDDRHVLELIQDTYSTDRDVRGEESLLKLPVILDEKTEYMQVEQPLTGQSGRVVDARFLPDFPKHRAGGNNGELEATGKIQMLIYDDEGVLQGASARWEGNSQLHADDACNLLMSAKPNGKIQILTSMDDMVACTQLQLSIRCSKTEQIPMITGMEMEDLREGDPDRPSLILRNGNGESLWDLAKQSNSTVAAIQSVNGLDGEVAPDRMILIPVL